LALLRTQLIFIQIILSFSHVAAVVSKVYSVDLALWYESFQLRRTSGSTLREEARRLYRKGLDPAATASPTASTTNAFDQSRSRAGHSNTQSRAGFLPERSYAEEQAKHAEFGDRQQIEATCLLMISLGCIIIFGAVAPIMVPFCMAVFALELRFTAHMLATHAKRPVPGHRLGIGAWKQVLAFVMKVGVAFSGFLLVTYSDTFRGTSTVTKVSGAVTFFVAMILTWEVVNILWPPIDKEVAILAGRRARVEHKIREACMDNEQSKFLAHPRREPSNMLNTAVRDMRYHDIPSLDQIPPQLLAPRTDSARYAEERAAMGY
jgi:hypothetical protein